jgi:hypothetical protein
MAEVPLPGVRVFLLTDTAQEVGVTTTDSEGVARLRLVEGTKGKWIIAARANAVSGIQWYPTNRQYFIVMCGSTIP